MAEQIGENQWKGQDGKIYGSEGEANVTGGHSDGGSGAGWGSMSGFGGDVAGLALVALKLYLWLIKSGILPCIIIGAVFSATIGIPYNLITKTPYTSNIAAWLITTVIGFIISFFAWRKKKKILLFTMIALCIPGFIYGFVTKYGFANDPSTMSMQMVTVNADSTALIGNPFGSGSKMLDIKKGEPLKITGEARERWTPVDYNNNEGWVLTEDIKIQIITPDQTDNALVIADTADVYSSLSATSKVINILAKGTEISLIGVHDRYPSWARITLEGKNGWILTEKIQMHED